jgi:hypothetical protein
MLTADGGMTVNSCPDERDSFIGPVMWVAKQNYTSRKETLFLNST